MSIPPLEKILIPTKSQEASQVQHSMQQKQEHAQNQIGIQYSNTIRRNNEQTVKMSKSENNEYRYDAKEKGNGKFSGKKKGKRDKKQKEDEKQIHISGFDMRI